MKATMPLKSLRHDNHMFSAIYVIGKLKAYLIFSSGFLRHGHLCYPGILCVLAPFGIRRLRPFPLQVLFQTRFLKFPGDLLMLEGFGQ